MPSHAEKNQTEIENYYHIIDPEVKLSENDRAKEENKVVANMPPWLSFALIAKAGFSLAATKEQLAHLMILNCMYMRSIDEVNEYLRERGNASLSRETAQDCRAS